MSNIQPSHPKHPDSHNPLIPAKRTFRRSVPSKYSRISDTPGPGAYRVPDSIGPQMHTRSVPGWSQASSERFDDRVAESLSPGPAAHATAPEPQLARVYSFGKAAQRGLPGAARAGPAPNAYAVREKLGASSPAFGFGKGERDVTFGARDRSPGPAAGYRLPAGVGKQHAGKGIRGGRSAPTLSFGTGKRFAAPAGAAHTPGPDAYSPRAESQLGGGAALGRTASSPRFSFGTSDRARAASPRGRDSPGPAAYDIPDLTGPAHDKHRVSGDAAAPGWKFGTQTRFARTRASSPADDAARALERRQERAPPTPERPAPWSSSTPSSTRLRT